MAEPSLLRYDPVAGVLWMLGSGLSFVLVTVFVRYIGTDLPAIQTTFLRYLIGIAFVAPALVAVLRVNHGAFVWGLFGLRGALHCIAATLWFFAMARIPVAEVTAIGYLNPIVVTLGAVVFFGERLAARRIAAVAIALLGALVILRPGLREIGEGQIAQLGAAIGFAASYLVVKRMTGLVQPGHIVAVLTLTVALGLAPFAMLVWVPVGNVQLALLAGTAAFGTLGHYCMTRAFEVAPMTVTQPVTFLQLVWATLLGALVFSEPVDPWVLGGGGMIIAAISYMTWREGQLRRQTVTPSPIAPKL
jgi:drug/metabolite transporter (DMT)-like permease